MSAILSVNNVTKTYGEGATAVHALSGVSVDVARGEVMLLVGPSGSGKTTLLSIMGAILKPSAGSVRIGGEEIVGRRERDLPRIRLQHIGFVFQGFNLFPALSVVENVALALDIRGISGKAARVRASDMLERVGLGAKLDSMPADLSGGQKQRVAIARALVGEPSILLADEPTAALDSNVGRTVMDLLRSLAHDQNRAVVIVTHDSRVFDYADRIVHIRDGRLHEDAPHEGTRSSPSAHVGFEALTHNPLTPNPSPRERGLDFLVGGPASQSKRREEQASARATSVERGCAPARETPATRTPARQTPVREV